MSLNHQDSSLENIGQSPGCDPKTSKRNSGLFAFLKWFKPSSTSRESIDTDLQNSQSSSCDSLNSTISNGTVASFSYINPSAYVNNNRIPEKCIILGPETDTYKARLKQRDKRRENDKNLTLRKKYNLFFNRETLLKTVKKDEEENTKSLPLMTRAMDEEQKTHRRTNSESSKTKKAGAYLHVKGKRKAPQPPGFRQINEGNSTMSLRRKKRLAPPPPVALEQKEDTIEYADADIIFNDCLKLEHGILKSAKEDKTDQNSNSPSASARSSCVEPIAPVSPRPWYKRNSRVDNANKKEKDHTKIDHKYEPIERLPDVQYTRNSTIDLTIDLPESQNKKKTEEKRKSGMSFLTNISELDREASEIIKKEHEKNGELPEIPQFMRPRDDPKANTDSWVSPKRRSAKDLIAKFNAITNVTKVTVNSAFFGGVSQKEQKRDYFGRKEQKQELLLESHKKRIDLIDKKINNPLMKSESASAIKLTKPETPKQERKTWHCPKCLLENEYWRIICHVCSAIKPYFDELEPSPSTKIKEDTSHEMSTSEKSNADKILERSKTQIGFSALASYNLNRAKRIEKSISLDEKSQQKEAQNKNEERERLKKMLIEMKNSLPKRKSNILMKQNSRTSVIEENSDHDEEADETNHQLKDTEKTAEIVVAISETIYENIKVKKTDESKPIKVSNSVQTNPAYFQNDKKDLPKKIEPILKKKEQNLEPERTKNAELDSKIVETNIKASFDKINPRIGETDLKTPTNKSNLKVVDADVKAPINKINSKVDTVLTQPKTVEAKMSNGVTERAVKIDPPITLEGATRSFDNIKTNFELMRPKDFENIYSDPNAQSPARIYANLARNDELSLFFNMPKKFNELKSNIKKVSDKNTDTIEVNRLLRKLETAIAKGEMIEASNYAKELAQLKVNCSVIRQRSMNETPKRKGFNIEMYVEDKISHRGPFTIEVTADQTVLELKKQVEQEFEIPVNVQRWILGKELATNDKLSLKDHNITEGCPVFLYLVAPDVKNSSNLIKQNKELDAPSSSKIEIKPTQKVLDEIKIPLVESKPEVHVPKIVDVIPKVTEIQKKLKTDFSYPTTEQTTPIFVSNAAVKLNQKEKELQKPQAAESKITAGPSKVNPAPSISITKAVLEDDFEEYDSKTLKPQPTEWECQLCTLLNPINSNICAICATVRKKEVAAPRKSTKKKTAPQPTKIESQSDQTYLQLVNLDNADLVENTEPFECVICFLEIEKGQGVTLRECLHQFCKACLAFTIEYNEDAEVRCPYRDDQYSCNIALQDREIKALVTPHVYEQHLAKSMSEAENKIGKSFHCKTPDCKGWCIFEDNVNEFRCPVCRRINCLTCQAIHTGMNCKQYQEKMNQESEIDDDAKRTKEMVDEMVRKGEALTCPTCQVILMKKWGCDWVRCSMCKTEICWVTRGPRWGPGGKGDTSGGCQCGVNGVKCHPQCSYCH